MKEMIKRRVSHFFSNLLEEALSRDSRNIERWRQRRALEETGKFIEENLPLVMSVNTRYALYEKIAQCVRGKAGLICEFGVAGGKSINFIAKLLPDHPIYGFDSFEGLPEDWRDLHPQGIFKQERLPPVEPNVRLIKGLFADTLPAFLQQHPEPALFLHIDCDLYASTKTVLEMLRPRIQEGTILCFDEFFNYPGWKEGEYKAFREFAAQTKLQYEYFSYCRYGTQAAIKVL